MPTCWQSAVKPVPEPMSEIKWSVSSGSLRHHRTMGLYLGPGGSAACAVRVAAPDGAAALVWSAAMSKAHRSTTNNQAEYHGLLAGLRVDGWPNLEVVGDSTLIVRQMREYHPSKNARLIRLYSQVHRLADQLAARHWTHHVRAHTKMAESLANLAVDTCTSSQL
jgi:ribonuclease HI